MQDLEQHLDVSYNTARQIIDELCDAHILIRADQKKRGQLFRFQKYIDMLEREYEG